MSSTAKLTSVVAGLTLVVIALAGCTAASEPAASTPSEKPVAAEPAAVSPAKPSSTPTPVSTPLDPCPSPRPVISLVQDGRKTGHSFTEGAGKVTGVLDGELIDLGPREFAKGAVKLNSAGEIVSYTVASGDAILAINKRFCVTDYYSIIGYNSGLEPLRSRPAHQKIQPGDVLVLRPDPEVEWLPPVD